MEAGSDVELVESCRRGDREAFQQMVERYQSLLCSLTYSLTGDFGLSQDLAQETFLTAWRELPRLREPARLRGWLCGIARNLANNTRRRTEREARATTAAWEAATEVPAPDPTPAEHAVSRDEAAIVWQALEQVPEAYREPLILFYREQQSVQNTAALLGLSEDAVKQRLSRGRKLVQEQVLALVESTLERTTPGKVFTLAVLGAVPALAPASAAASVAATAAKGTAAAKSAAGLGGLSAILGPVLGVLGGYLGLKASIDNTRSPRERALVVALVRLALIFVVNFTVTIFAFLFLGRRLTQTHPAIYVGVLAGLMVLYTTSLLGLAVWGKRRLSAIRSEEAGLAAAAETPELDLDPQRRSFEFKSKWRLLGLPLLHVKFGDYYARKFAVARGWIAIGDSACGVLFAAGWVAVGGIAFGGVLGIGLLASALAAFGGVALGVEAVGIAAFGGCAFGWMAAWGGVALSRGYALGGAAVAPHANDPAAREFFKTGLATTATTLLRHAYVLVIFAVWPLILSWRQRCDRGGEGAGGKPPPAPQNASMSQEEGPTPEPPRAGESRSGAAGPDPESRKRDRRKRLWRLAALAVVFGVSLYFFVTLRPLMKSAGSIVAYILTLFSFLCIIFQSLGLFLRGGFTPGWQIRCPKCGLTVDASKGGMVRIGAWGVDHRWGWCSRCQKHRMLIIEPKPPADGTKDQAGPKGNDSHS